MNPPADRPRRKWLAWGLGCAAIAAVVCCGAPAAGLLWLHSKGVQFAEAHRRETVDRLFRDVLADGDGAAAFDRADPRFRAAHPRDEVIRFFARPALRDRDRLTASATLIASTPAGAYYKVAVTVAGEDEPLVVYYVYAGGVMVLLGLEPGLDAAVPADVRGQFVDPHAARGWDFD